MKTSSAQVGMQDLDQKWYLWHDGDRPPSVNMAVDELLLERADILSGAILLRIYGWDRPSISIGYTQHYSSVASEIGRYSIVRRPTGGGIVYHDRDLTYTLVVPDGHPVVALDRVESYHVFHRAVLRTLKAFGLVGRLADQASMVHDRAAMKCFVTPTKYDVLCGNRKLAGAAQRRTRKGILHQGSISLEISEGDRKKLACGLAEGFKEEFKTDFNDFTVPENFIADAESLASAKFAADEWNMSR